MNQNELYHYGVPGMKWGVRRARNQLANLTGRDRNKISDEEAGRFHKDVNTAKKMKDTNAREQWVKSISGKNAAGKKYAEAVLTQAKKERVSSYVTKPAIAAGIIATTPFWAGTVSSVVSGLAPIGKAVGKAVGKTLFWWT